MSDLGPILEIRMQEHDYACCLCGGHQPGPGGWCLSVLEEDAVILVCKPCHDARPTGEITLAELFAAGGG